MLRARWIGREGLGLRDLAANEAAIAPALAAERRLVKMEVDKNYMDVDKTARKSFKMENGQRFEMDSSSMKGIGEQRVKWLDFM